MEYKITKQLNRIAFLLGKEGEDEDKIKMVLQGTLQQAESNRVLIMAFVEKPKCVICDSPQEGHEFTLSCGHTICSNDCMAELLISPSTNGKISCPLDHCEVSTPKQALFQTTSQEQDLQDMILLCTSCQSYYPIQQTLKLSCGHRFCLLCTITILNQEDDYFKNRCPICLECITLQNLQKLKNSLQAKLLI